jgi:hypothetical protein
MRLGLLVIALAACSSAATAGPAWPKPAAREVDGGESLAPRAAARAIAALIEDDKPSSKPIDKPAVAAALAGPDKPAATISVVEEPVTTEELVIEIDD